MSLSASPSRLQARCPGLRTPERDGGNFCDVFTKSAPHALFKAPCVSMDVLINFRGNISPTYFFNFAAARAPTPFAQSMRSPGGADFPAYNTLKFGLKRGFIKGLTTRLLKAPPSFLMYPSSESSPYSSGVPLLFMHRTK